MKVYTYEDFCAWRTRVREAKVKAFVARGHFPLMDEEAGQEYIRLSRLLTEASMLVSYRLQVYHSTNGYARKRLRWRVCSAEPEQRDGGVLQMWHTDTLAECIPILACLQHPFKEARYHIFGPLICSPDVDSTLSAVGVDDLADRLEFNELFGLDVPDI